MVFSNVWILQYLYIHENTSNWHTANGPNCFSRNFTWRFHHRIFDATQVFFSPSSLSLFLPSLCHSLGNRNILFLIASYDAFHACINKNTYFTTVYKYKYTKFMSCSHSTSDSCSVNLVQPIECLIYFHYFDSNKNRNKRRIPLHIRNQTVLLSGVFFQRNVF